MVGRKLVRENESVVSNNKRATNNGTKTVRLRTAKNDLKVNGEGNGRVSKNTRDNHPNRKQLNENHSAAVGKSVRTIFRDKKASTDVAETTTPNGRPTGVGKSVGTEFRDKRKSSTGEPQVRTMIGKPKRKKRMGMRLDPYDFTNKRMDDTPLTTDSSGEKKKEAEENKDVQLSKNAQFRAIQPSPSIVSFVEENLLGRRREIEIKRAGYNIELPVPLDNVPLSTSSERERIEEPVFRNKLTFFAAAKISSSLPPPELPEIAFAGRSNVGKSSMLNALTRQWGVVRTSDKPGLTQSINFFTLGPKLCLVDLPGYGFAYAKEEVKESWEELVKEYVSTRVGLRRVCLLIDTKWGMKPRDHELIDLMERSQTKYQIVLTKTDLVFPIDVARRAMQIEESLKAKKSAVQPVMMMSSKSGAGVRCLRTALAKIARFAKL